MSIPEGRRIEYVHVWASKQNQEDPGYKARISHKLSDKLRKWKKPRNVASLAYKGVMVMCPPGLSHAIDWGVDKVAGKASAAHHQRKAAEAADKYGDLPELEQEGKKLKHELKLAAKAQFDLPAKKVRDAREEFEKIFQGGATNGEACVAAKNMMRKFDYYKRRVRKLSEAAAEMRELVEKLEGWIKLNEDYITEIDGGMTHQTKLEKAVVDLTNHNWFCHDSKCVNWADEENANAILDQDLETLHGPTQKFGSAKGYGKL